MSARTDATRERLVPLLAPVVAQAGLDLDDVVVQQAGKRLLVRVVVDADGGAALDAVAAVSGPAGEVIDESGLLGEAAYVLEVTSPGVDRPLSEPRHWRRAAARLVRVTRADGSEIIGRVVGSDDDGVDLIVGDDTVRVLYAEVTRAVVQVEFTPAPATTTRESDDGTQD